MSERAARRRVNVNGSEEGMKRGEASVEVSATAAVGGSVSDFVDMLACWLLLFQLHDGCAGGFIAARGVGIGSSTTQECQDCALAHRVPRPLWLHGASGFCDVWVRSSTRGS